jgi:thiol:disulfide interchange protein DsbC
MRNVIFVIFLISALALVPAMALGFGQVEGSCESDCERCHQITIEEATDIVKAINPEIEVMDVRQSPVRGLWEIAIRARGKRGLAYVDFAKEHIISGSIIRAASRENLTNERMYDISRVDVSQIPLDDALVLGDPKAPIRVIVFDDPDCPYCRKLQREIKNITLERPDVVFLIKVLPLKIHPAAYKKAKAIVCEKSLKLLENSFEGRPLPEPSCETTEVDDTIDLADRMGITGTPTIILPDGGVIPGFKPKDELIGLIDQAYEAALAMEAGALNPAMGETGAPEMSRDTDISDEPMDEEVPVAPVVTPRPTTPQSTPPARAPH